MDTEDTLIRASLMMYIPVQASYVLSLAQHFSDGLLSDDALYGAHQPPQQPVSVPHQV